MGCCCNKPKEPEEKKPQDSCCDKKDEPKEKDKTCGEGSCNTDKE